MKLEERKRLLARLDYYIREEDTAWQVAKQKAYRDNNWFIPEFTDLAIENIADNYLQAPILDAFINTYQLPKENTAPKKVGIVMAGNVPLVGFHDLLCVFLAGHLAYIKPSSKDEALIRHLVNKMTEWEPEAGRIIQLNEMLKAYEVFGNASEEKAMKVIIEP